MTIMQMTLCIHVTGSFTHLFGVLKQQINGFDQLNLKIDWLNEPRVAWCVCGDIVEMCARENKQTRSSCGVIHIQNDNNHSSMTLAN